MRHLWTRTLAAIVVSALIAAGCGSSRDSDDAAEAPEATPTVEAEPAEGTGDGMDAATDSSGSEPVEPPPDDAPSTDEPVTFGDLESPCGPGEAAGATDTGVTDTTIQIGTADDRGFVNAPGLNREMGDTMAAMVEWCNQQGGIGGREIVLNVYDSAMFSAQAAQLEACDNGDFMMVGEGMAFDNLSLPERVACGMAHVPAWTVSGDAAHGPDMVQPVPNPVDLAAMTFAEQMRDLFPELVTNVGALLGNFPATRSSAAKIRAGTEGFFGWSWPDELYLEYNINGEEDWSSFINTLRDGGAGLVFFSGSCPNFFLNFMQQAAVQEYRPVTFADANFLSAECAASNTDGVLDDLHVRSVFVPFDEREASQAVDDYMTIVETLGSGEVTGLSLQSASAFLLWASGAKACGSDLTSACVLDAIGAIDEWTAGGLHAPTNPGSNAPTSCGALFRLEGTSFVRVQPEEPATFDCSDDHVVPVDTPFVAEANLDGNRVTQNVG